MTTPAFSKSLVLPNEIAVLFLLPVDRVPHVYWSEIEGEMNDLYVEEMDRYRRD